MSGNDDFSEEIIEPDAEGSGVNLEDFIAYPPTHVYLFKPCREIWIATGVDACVPPVPVLTKAGKPKRDKNGKAVAVRATGWLDQNQRVECMTWCPGQPMLIPDRLVVHGGWIERRGVSPSICTARRGLSSAMQRRRSHGSSTSTRCLSKRTPSTSSSGWRIGCSILARRSTTPWCWVATMVRDHTAVSALVKN